MAKKQRSSTNSEKAPYLRLQFYENPTNQFWETSMYSEKSKDYFRNWLAEWRSKERLYVSLSIVALLMLSSCADVEMIDQCTKGDEYGFWSGLWHGWIILFSFIGSLFNDEIAIYAVNNTGGWYDFGFFLGVGSAIGLTTSSTNK